MKKERSKKTRARRSRRKKQRIRRFTGARMSNEKLLGVKFSELNVRWEGTWIEDCH